MIDRAGRDRLAECIHQLAAGVLTNRQFEDKGEFESADDAIRAVFWGGPWLLYDDFRNYRLRGKYRLDPRVRKEAARWVLFSKTNLPYEWPVARVGVLASIVWVFANLLTLGLVARGLDVSSSNAATSPCGRFFVMVTMRLPCTIRRISRAL